MNHPSRNIALLAALAAAALPVVPAAAQVVSQGAYRIGADSYWGRGVTGAGQTVAVLDLGFGGLDASIAAGELPPRDQLVTQTFDRTWGFDGRSPVGELTEHGTRMAEIVHDVAPDARLVLVNYGTEQEFMEAVDWLVANGVPIVSHSNSFFTGPFDGSGATSRAVDRAAASGVLWVNSAGNFGERHWAGRAGPEGTTFPVLSGPGDRLSLTVSFPRVPGVAASVAVEQQQPDGSWAELSRSGATGRTPILSIDGAGSFRAVVRQDAGPPVDLEVYSRTAGFGSAAVPDGSVPTPGDAAGSLTVGAVPWTGAELAPYSSRGPTDDGRLKPDLVAPTYITANPAFPGTAGTSASTPHVAAAAALLRQERLAQGQPAGPGELRADLVQRAVDMGPAGPDPAYGAGMARLDILAPSVRVQAGGRRLARVRVADDGTVARLSVTVDGRLVRRVAGPVMSVSLAKLRRGRHRLVATAVDLSGNTAIRAAWVRAR